MVSDEIGDPREAAIEVEVDADIRALRDHLARGQLAVVVGSGVSAPLGLPTWSALVRICEAASGVSGSRSSSFPVRMEVVRRTIADDARFASEVRRALYSKIANPASLDGKIIANPMLGAIGSLVMSTARGTTTEVMTLNFDDFLNRYLTLHGFRTQVIATLPSLSSGPCDVRVFHLHGLLPFFESTTATKRIILTQRDFAERLEAPTSPWQNLADRLAQSKRLLFVGTSISDLDLCVHLLRARDAWGPNAQLGYVVDRKISADDRERFRELGVKAISVAKYSDVPSVLLRICDGGEVPALRMKS